LRLVVHDAQAILEPPQEPVRPIERRMIGGVEKTGGQKPMQGLTGLSCAYARVRSAEHKLSKLYYKFDVRKRPSSELEIIETRAFARKLVLHARAQPRDLAARGGRQRPLEHNFDARGFNRSAERRIARNHPRLDERLP